MKVLGNLNDFSKACVSQGNDMVGTRSYMVIDPSPLLGIELCNSMLFGQEFVELHEAAETCVPSRVLKHHQIKVKLNMPLPRVTKTRI